MQGWWSPAYNEKHPSPTVLCRAEIDGSAAFAWLITTAAGLAVAIPAVIFHRYFQRRVSVLVSQMEAVAHQLMDVLQQREHGTP